MGWLLRGGRSDLAESLGDGRHRQRFVCNRLLEHGPELKPAYTVCGGRVPDQHPVKLPGYPGGSDIVGNWVYSQFQLDAFGEALMLFAAAAGHDRLDADGWRAVEVAAEAIDARWHEKDARIWEIEPDRWTHSRLICAGGLRAISRCLLGGGDAARWLALVHALLLECAADQYTWTPESGDGES